MTTRRLSSLFLSATPVELDLGLTWYAAAHEEALGLCDDDGTGLTIDQAAGIIAALSPRCSWPHNVKRAVQLVSTGATYGLNNGVDKARRILAGEDPDTVLSGNKVRSFYDNIARPATSESVTIDGHAYDAAAGHICSDRERKALERVGEYDRIADMYRWVASREGLAPHVVQATVWCVWRNRYGRYHYQKIQQED